MSYCSGCSMVTSQGLLCGQQDSRNTHDFNLFLLSWSYWTDCNPLKYDSATSCKCLSLKLLQASESILMLLAISSTQFVFVSES